MYDTIAILNGHHKAVVKNVCSEGWTQSYPEWVRETFVLALKTEVLPPYAIGRVEKALKVAQAINKRLNRDAALADTAKAGPKANAKANARKADKRARDRELRMKMKGRAGQKS